MSYGTGVLLLDHGKTRIALSRIEYLTGDGSYSRIHVVGAKYPIVVARPLKYMAARLPDFMRIHKATLVNPRFIERVTTLPRTEAFVSMKNGQTLTISRRIAANPNLCRPY